MQLLPKISSPLTKPSDVFSVSPGESPSQASETFISVSLVINTPVCDLIAGFPRGRNPSGPLPTPPSRLHGLIRLILVCKSAASYLYPLRDTIHPGLCFGLNSIDKVPRDFCHRVRSLPVELHLSPTYVAQWHRYKRPLTLALLPPSPPLGPENIPTLTPPSLRTSFKSLAHV